MPPAPDTSPAAVYERGIGYNDENYYLTVDPRFDQELERWRRGEASAFAERFARVEDDFDDADRLVSVHATLAEAEQAARAGHAQRTSAWTFVDLGFHLFGCRPIEREYDDDGWDGDWAATPIDDLERLTAWCLEHAVEMPGLDSDDPAVRTACEQIAARSREGDMWLDCWEYEGAKPFAADLVAERLQAAGRGDVVPDLWRHLVGDFTYVGPAPRISSAGHPPDAVGSASPPSPPDLKPGILRRLFGS